MRIPVPEFKNPGSWNDNATPADLFDDLWLGGDFHLQSDSPCVDSGLNGASELPVYDFEGAPRISDGNSDGSAVVDIGADEFIRRSISTPGTSLLLLFQ